MQPVIKDLKPYIPFYISIIFMLMEAFSVAEEILNRAKRSAPDFHKAITCYQPKILVLKDYPHYGCYCGFGGYGTPLDDTDQCCKDHDRCFDKLEFYEKTFKEQFLISMQGHLLLGYYSNCENGEFTCDAENNTPYLQGVCECDRAAAKCFYEHSDTYRPQLYSLEKERYCENMTNRHELNLTEYENRKIQADIRRAQLWPDVFNISTTTATSDTKPSSTTTQLPSSSESSSTTTQLPPSSSESSSTTTQMPPSSSESSSTTTELPPSSPPSSTSSIHTVRPTTSSQYQEITKAESTEQYTSTQPVHTYIFPTDRIQLLVLFVFFLGAAVCLYLYAAHKYSCCILPSLNCSRRNKQLMRTGCPDILNSKKCQIIRYESKSEELSVTTHMLYDETTVGKKEQNSDLPDYHTAITST